MTVLELCPPFFFCPYKYIANPLRELSTVECWISILFGSISLAVWAASHIRNNLSVWSIYSMLYISYTYILSFRIYIPKWSFNVLLWNACKYITILFILIFTMKISQINQNYSLKFTLWSVTTNCYKYYPTLFARFITLFVTKLDFPL